MQIPVLIEKISGNGYRATSGEPLPLQVEGVTREDALAKINSEIQTRLRNGAELVSMELGPERHSLTEFAGMFRDDPRIEDWKKSVAEYRRKIDKDADRP